MISCTSLILVFDFVLIICITFQRKSTCYLQEEKNWIIFQDFNLIPSLNVWENVVLPIGLDGHKVDEDKILEILDHIGLTDKKHAMAF